MTTLRNSVDDIGSKAASPTLAEALVSDPGFNLGSVQSSRPCLLENVIAHVIDGPLAGGEWVVSPQAGVYWCARSSVSCMISPQAADLVQITKMGDRCWVTAVLERHGPEQGVALDFGAAVVSVHAGAVRINADEEVALMAETVSSRAQRITHAAVDRQSKISGTDTTDAGNSLLYTEKHLTIHAKSTSITSSTLLKLDAGQIHMG